MWCVAVFIFRGVYNNSCELLISDDENVVTMNIVYLVDESRATYGEKEINDPPVKLMYM